MIYANSIWKLTIFDFTHNIRKFFVVAPSFFDTIDMDDNDAITMAKLVCNYVDEPESKPDTSRFIGSGGTSELLPSSIL